MSQQGRRSRHADEPSSLFESFPQIEQPMFVRYVGPQSALGGLG